MTASELKVTILDMNYQRNGVGGIGFYQAIIRTSDGYSLIATFETFKDNKNTIVIESVRATDPLYFQADFRGDVIGDAISTELYRLERVYGVLTIDQTMEKIRGRR